MSDAKRCDGCGDYSDAVWLHIHVESLVAAYGLTYDYDACSPACAHALVDRIDARP